MSTFNVEKYVPTINSILRVSDLSTISAKKIRKALAHEFPNDNISDPQNKKVLDQRILECFSVIRGEASSDEETNATPVRRHPQDLLQSDLMHPSSPAVKRKEHPSSPPTGPSPPKKARSTPPSKPKTKPVKQEKTSKEYVYDSDEDAKFAAELDMALNSGRTTRGGTSSTKPKSRSKKQKNGDKDDKPKKKRAPNPDNPFMAPMLLSPQLAEVVFETELPRPTVVKKLWEYIKSNDLQNPKDRREILCDDKLRALFGLDSVKMFQMNKILSKHLWSKADVVGSNPSENKFSSTTPSQTSTPIPPARNGKQVSSHPTIKSNNQSDQEQSDDASEHSHFSDSEDD